MKTRIKNTSMLAAASLVLMMSAPSIFAQVYKRWDQDGWQPSHSQKKLMDLGCMPYYKFVGVWAKRLDEDAKLKSLEHENPVTIKSGKYVAIGSDGEPYSMGEDTLHSRYEERRRKVSGWFKRIFGATNPDD